MKKTNTAKYMQKHTEEASHIDEHKRKTTGKVHNKERFICTDSQENQRWIDTDPNSSIPTRIRLMIATYSQFHTAPL